MTSSYKKTKRDNHRRGSKVNSPLQSRTPNSQLGGGTVDRDASVHIDKLEASVEPLRLLGHKLFALGAPGSFPKYGLHYRSTIVLVIGTPKMVTLIKGTPLGGLQIESFAKRLVTSTTVVIGV